MVFAGSREGVDLDDSDDSDDSDAGACEFAEPPLLLFNSGDFSQKMRLARGRRLMR